MGEYRSFSYATSHKGTMLLGGYAGKKERHITEVKAED